MCTNRRLVTVTGFYSSPLLHHAQCMLDVYTTERIAMQGMTQPAPRLSERDLIAAMEEHGIGTDATVAEHISKQLDRGYATKDQNLTFWPTPLGESLIAAYKKMGLANLWLPDLRCILALQVSHVLACTATGTQRQCLSSDSGHMCWTAS